MLSHFHQPLRQTEPSSRRSQVVRRPLATLAATCCAVLVATIGYSGSAQGPTTAQSGQAEGPPHYNPYPPGILPPDLDAEIARVRAEMRTIFGRYLAQAQALPPLTFSNTQGIGNPPTIQGSGYEAVQILGGLLNYDENMSPLRNVGCASCHMPYAGFSGPIPSVNLTMVAYPGTFYFRAGKRTAQRYTYAPQFPVLHFNETLQAFVGGAFWDARARRSAGSRRCRHHIKFHSGKCCKVGWFVSAAVGGRTYG